MAEGSVTCLRCRYFRLLDEIGGLCRVDKGQGPDYPKTASSGHCPRWRDCGQQYFIRLGWLRAKKRASADVDQP
jgi:hypothetical protein